MKFLISTLFLFVINANAMISIQTFNKQNGLKVQSIFTEKYKIPSELIKIRLVKNKCVKCSQDTAACLCINKKGELNILSSDMKTLKKSFLIFRSPTTELL